MLLSSRTSLRSVYLKSEAVTNLKKPTVTVEQTLADMLVDDPEDMFAAVDGSLCDGDADDESDADDTIDTEEDI